jgi:hypothetical protein
MALDKYYILAALPKSSLKDGGHLNCKECGFQSCVVFAMKVANGKTQLSECPHISDGTINQLNHGVNQSTPVLEYTTESNDAKQSGVIDNAMAVLSIPNDNLFITNKDELKEFSTQLPQETNLPTVPTEGGFFGLFEHNVTGEELNKLTESIQGRMIEQNKALFWKTAHQSRFSVIPSMSGQNSFCHRPVWMADKAAKRMSKDWM